MNRKVLFFDIDGTLITNDERKIFPDDTREAIRKAKANGHLLFINTGRVYINVEDYIKSDFDGLVMGCGTNIVYKDEELFYRTLPREECLRIALLSRQCRMYGAFEKNDRISIDMEMEGIERIPIFEFFLSTDRRIERDIYSDEFLFDKFAIWYDQNSDRDTFIKAMEKDYTIIDREGDFYEVVSKGFSKATGIEFVLKHFGIAKEDSFVFGDSNNDIEMMEYAGISVAMGNATDECKEKASYITGDILEHGISDAMKHFELI